MNERFDEEKLRAQLSGVTQLELVLFALSCAERMLPNYRRFVFEHEWGNEAILRGALDLGWNWLEGIPIEATTVRKFQQACNDQAPNTENFSTISVSSALDAANAAAIVAGLIVDPDVDKVIELASYARDSVDMFVQEHENMLPQTQNLEECIRLHPLMQSELVRQREALDSIISGITLHSAAKQWRALERGCLDI